MAEARTDAERLELPEPAGTIWRAARKLLDEIRDAEPANEVLLGGGTILACRWNHRGSTDIDTLVTGPDSLKVWMEGQPRDGAKLTGGEWENPSEEHLRIVWESGSLDMTANDPRPRTGARKARIGDAEVKVLTTTQILRGKLTRAVQGRSPVRDLFDFATAAERDPQSLAEAAGMLRRSEIGTITKNWRERAGEYARKADTELRSVSGGAVACPEIGRTGAQALEDHTTTRIVISADSMGSLKATRSLKNGAAVSHELDPEAPEQSAEACGLTGYMAHNEGSTLAEVINRWRRGPEGERDGVIYDSRTAPPGIPEADRDPLAGLGRPKNQTAQKNRRAVEREIKQRWMRLQDTKPGRKNLVAVLETKVREERSKAEQRGTLDPPALPDRGSGHQPGKTPARQERDGRSGTR